MKREVWLLAVTTLVLALAGPVSAMEKVHAGVKGGVAIANQTVDPESGELADSRSGLALGGWVGIPVAPNGVVQLHGSLFEGGSITAASIELHGADIRLG